MPAGDSGKEYAGEVTTYVIVACVVAASGGALFGYSAENEALLAKVPAVSSCLVVSLPSALSSTKEECWSCAGMTTESLVVSYPW